MDPAGQAVEDEVNDALPYRFRFHKISKLVLILGPGASQAELYRESLGVAQKLVADFDLPSYAAALDDEKRARLRQVVVKELTWFQESFEDAGFIAQARAKLTW